MDNPKTGLRMTPNNPDSIALLRSYLQHKSPNELIALLLDLVQPVDEPTHQQSRNRLAPPSLATTDLRYPSADIFLAALDGFEVIVDESGYRDGRPSSTSFARNCSSAMPAIALCGPSWLPLNNLWGCPQLYAGCAFIGEYRRFE